MKSALQSVKSSGNFIRIVLALLTIQTGFGLYPVIAKKLGVGSEFNPLIFCMVRDASSFPVLVLLALISDGWLGFPKWKDCLVFVGLGICGIFLSQFFFLLGVSFAGANIASIFQQLIPIWTTILTIITCTEDVPSFRRPSTWFIITGILFAISGAIEITLFTSTSQSTTNSQYPWLGYIFLTLNSGGTSVYIVCQKIFIFDKPKNYWRNHPIWVTTWSYLTGSIFISLSSLYYVTTPSAFFISQEEWLAIIYAIIITSNLCFILISWANSKTSATIVTAFWPFQVIPCFFGSYMLNGEELNYFQYIGCVFVIIGLFAVVFGKFLEERRKNTET
ncbi:WAT1-related protein [Oopsacas minuta]|uniref:WAT1-related protein n=1 Tax=Oopsacas minuta TaxID=111878 RepID=A0AAV7KK62_9METZ|nr:WAT1-related protein [Oopsacas minuta]